MDDLISFLRAQLDARSRQLDEDEQVARGVSSGPWTTVTTPDRSGPATTLELGGQDDRVVLTGFADDDPLRPTEAEHIARWDPARVLEEVRLGRAEVEAKRRILDAVLPQVISLESTIHGEFSAYPEVDVPDLLLKTLAQPSAGRDGWREEWAT